MSLTYGSDGLNPKVMKTSTGTNGMGVLFANNVYNIGGTDLNYQTSNSHITTSTTTTPTAVTSYVQSISILVTGAGTTSTITIQDKAGTPLKIVNLLATTAVGNTPTVINFTAPVKFTGGIDIVTAGAVAATVEVLIAYWQ